MSVFLNLQLKLVPMNVRLIMIFTKFNAQLSEIYNVKKELEKEINNFISTEIEWIPLNSVKVQKEKNEGLVNFFDSLEDDDDVQNILFKCQSLQNRIC